jgi:ketosteroid isomerase-like protein
MLRLIALAAMFLLTQTGAAAQEATPSGLPTTPDPSECQGIERLTVEDIHRVAATPSAGEPEGPSILGANATPTAGELADSATTAEINATIRTFYACVNAGDWAAALSLYADETLRYLLVDPTRNAGIDPTTADYPFLTQTPEPLPQPARHALLSSPTVTIRADGRAVTSFEATGLRPDGRTQTVFVVLTREDGSWKLVSPLDSPTLGNLLATPATPTP